MRILILIVLITLSIFSSASYKDRMKAEKEKKNKDTMKELADFMANLENKAKQKKSLMGKTYRRLRKGFKKAKNFFKGMYDKVTSLVVGEAKRDFTKAEGKLKEFVLADEFEEGCLTLCADNAKEIFGKDASLSDTLCGPLCDTATTRPQADEH